MTMAWCIQYKLKTLLTHMYHTTNLHMLCLLRFLAHLVINSKDISCISCIQMGFY